MQVSSACRLTCSNMTLQANYLGSAVVNNVNVLDLLLGSKEAQVNGVVPHQGRKLSQIIPGRTGVYQTGSSTIQVYCFSYMRTSTWSISSTFADKAG